MDSQNSDEQIIPVDVRRYAEAVAKYKWIIAAIVGVAITAAVLYTERVTPIYEAIATVKIDPRLPDLLGQGQELTPLGSGGAAASAEYYKAEREILHSYQLIRRTVEANELQLVLLDEDERRGRTPEEVIDLATQRLREDLSIDYPEQNRIFEIVVRGPDAALAARIANAHLDTYVAYTRGQLSTGTQKASKFLASEVDLAKKELADTDAQIVEFQKANGVMAGSLEDRQSLVSSNIANFTDKLNLARAARLEKAAMLSRLERVSKDDVLDSPIIGLSKSLALDSLKTQYYLERNKFLEIEKEVGPKNVDYVKQKAKVDDLYKTLQTEARLVVRTVEEELAAATANERALEAEVARAKAEELALGPKVVEYTQLLRKRKSDEDRYNIVNGRFGTSEITSRNDMINVTPLDPARAPDEPVSPNLRENVALAGGLGLGLGVGLALLLAFLDRTVKNTEDLAQATTAPVLGIIPMLSPAELASNDDKTRDRFVFEHPTSRVAECCRSLRTNILFSAADRSLGTLVVSSASPREGKTTSVIYLGTTMAQSGQRVLLVDTDMRRPRLHLSTGVSRQRGLSNLIVGEVAYEDVIKTTDIPNLYLLPCGPLPPNPAELLMTKRFEAVLGELRGRFDRIILDSPPLQAVTDAVVLSKLTDGVILVVKAAKTLRDDVTRAVKQVTDVGGVVTGVILNELDIDDRRYGSYYQYYSYGKEAGQSAEPA